MVYVLMGAQRACKIRTRKESLEKPKMAANCARRTLGSSSFSILSGFTKSSSAAKLAGFASAKPTSARVCRNKLPYFSRLPVELGCAQSLMPLHSITASALLTSMLYFKSGNWGWLSEGFATTL